MLFFLWQIVAITLEDFVIATASSLGWEQSLGTTIFGWMWVFAWLCFSCGTYVGWTFPAGISQKQAMSLSVLQPALQYVGAMIGVDLVATVTPALRG